MNIFDLYDSYRCQHADEFRKLLEAVAKTVLNLTENIPKEEALEVFKTCAKRKWVYLSENTGEEGFLFVDFNGRMTYQYPYDDTAAKALDRFMETYYPHIVCQRRYNLNLYHGTIEFCFEYKIDCDNEEMVLDDGCLELTTLFNDDMTVLLKQKVDVSCWQGLINSNYKHGLAFVQMKIN